MDGWGAEKVWMDGAKMVWMGVGCCMYTGFHRNDLVRHDNLHTVIIVTVAVNILLWLL